MADELAAVAVPGIRHRAEALETIGALALLSLAKGVLA